MADVTVTTNEAQESTQEQTVDTASLQAELDRLKNENARLKSAQSNASADASKFKKALQERMSEQERAETETRELIEQLKADNANLKRAHVLAEQKASYIGLGFDAATAEKAATAAYDTDFVGLTSALKEFLTAHDKAIMAEAVRQTPRPGAGNTDAPAVTREQFNQMGYQERLKLHEEQPEIYKDLMRRNE